MESFKSWLLVEEKDIGQDQRTRMGSADDTAKTMQHTPELGRYAFMKKKAKKS